MDQELTKKVSGEESRRPLATTCWAGPLYLDVHGHHQSSSALGPDSAVAVRHAAIEIDRVTLR
jgi:hypothetical protein